MNEGDFKDISKELLGSVASSDIIKSPRRENISFTYIDLFCGIGSFHYSFNKFNWRCIMASDINQAARETYYHNYNIRPLGDICDIEPSQIQPFDILCAGFPCQPFSQIGQHRGLDDERGQMFFQTMKFVHFHHPKILILENVPALLTHDNGKTFQHMINEIEKIGYILNYKILRCDDYGIPQMRKRLFVIAVSTNVKGTMLNLLDLEKSQTPSLSEFLGRNFEKNRAYTIRCGGRHSPLKSRHNWDTYLVDDKEYRLTLDDCLKLQGFTDFVLCGNNKERWQQVGNTIPTNLTYKVGLSVKRFLEECLNN